ncbi:MAG: hypothetical protein DLM58_21545 [Pseudonocardiales bacterium]|nr:MAG: hypothetical protein DLM58_21545 [Pseudonocardiales bacterium]
MTETPEETIARLQRELDNAKIAKLQHEIAQARSGVTPLKKPAYRSAQSWPPPDVLLGRPAGPLDSNLAPVPRRVPLTFRLLVLPWSWWTVFTLFMIAVAPIAVWIFVPLAGLITVAVTFLVIAGLRLRRFRRQVGLLKWGEVAAVNAADPTSIGTYYSGTTYQNVRLAQAHGWQVARRWYSGPSTTTKVSYELNGTRGELKMRGLPYAGGVILAHSKDPKIALCVSSFPYDLDRDQDGNWVGRLGPRVVIGSIAMATVTLVWTVGLLALFYVGATR